MKAPDRIDVAQQALVQVLTNPATWLPFVPLAAAYAFIGLPWWLCLPLALVMLVGVVGVWARRWPVLTERARTSLLKNYRDAENAGIYARIRELADMMSHLPTKRLLYDLGEAVEIKLAVEKRLFADGTITPHEEEVDDMIAELVRSMLNETEKAAVLESTQWPQATARLEKALESLRRMFEQLDVILDPIPESLRLPVEADVLSRASERLDEKLQQARGVRRHLEQGMIVPDAGASPDAEPSNHHPEKSPAVEG